MKNLSRLQSKRLLRFFTSGSLAVLLICLCSAALIFSSTFLAKERKRADLSLDQLSHFFEFQHRPITEEMWTQNYEAIRLRVTEIAKLIGHAQYNVMLAKPTGECVYHADDKNSVTTCNVPPQLQNFINSFRVESDVAPDLRFDQSSNRYIYMVPLNVGPVFKGFLYAAFTDPYSFFRGGIAGLAFKLFLPVILGVLCLWFLWLIVSKRFILNPYLSGLVELEKKQALGDLAAQVAHDIQSPLATLTSVVRTLVDIEDKKRQLLTSAASRIENLANDLLINYADPSAQDDQQFTFVTVVVNSIIAEKTAILGENSNITLQSDIKRDSLLSGVPLSANELSRILSNLLNNAVDATKDVRKGSIEVQAERVEGRIHISVKDNGKGMSPEVLHRVQSVGGSHGKTPTNKGLGLQHAKTVLARAGGILKINSAPNLGTIVTLDLPHEFPPSVFVQKLEIAPNEQVVILEDDESVHLLWKERLAGIDAVYLKDPEEFDIQRYPKSKCWYIFDHEIAGTAVKGLDLINSHHLGSRAILATSHFNDPKIQAETRRLGAGLLPKFMISEIEVEICVKPEIIVKSNSSKTPDLVLIDDDPDVHELWEFGAEEQHKHFVGVTEPAAFYSLEIDRRVPVYIDKKLSRGVSGLAVAEELHHQGFENLFITTGEKVPRGQRPSFIKGVVGKEFPQI